MISLPQGYAVRCRNALARDRAITSNISASGPIIAAGGFDRAEALAIVESGDADLVAFGWHFSSNPDLPYPLQHNLPLTPSVRSAFWGGDERGYTDFPAVDVAQTA